MFNRTKRKLLVAEIVLLIASVLIFRGLWMLLDMVSFMHGAPALAISLFLGIAVAIPAMRYIINKEN